jgi:hypothetical protein
MKRSILALAFAFSLVAIEALCGCQKYGTSSIPFTRQWRLNRICEAEGREFLDKEHLTPGERPSTVQAFYSQKVNTCVQIEIYDRPPWSSGAKWSYIVRDVTNGFLHWSLGVNPVAESNSDRLIKVNPNQIFDCSPFGANSAILSKVREYHGDVADKTYSLWLDNGNGGPPATIKTPDHPYSQDDCERLMRRKLEEL